MTRFSFTVLPALWTAGTTSGIKVEVLYDNYLHDENLQPDWGFTDRCINEVKLFSP